MSWCIFLIHVSYRDIEKFYEFWYRDIIKLELSPAGKHLGLLLVLLKNKCACYSYKYKVITHNYVS